MIQFTEQFGDFDIVATLARQLSWSHFLVLIPLGLILYAESSREQVELLEMHKDGIMVAEYWMELPPKHELEQKIHSLLLEAKERIARNKLLK